MVISPNATPYVTRQGDMLDLVCRRRYGSEHGGVVETVLDFNPHLAERGAVLPAGLTILLPDLPKPVADRAGTIDLWD